MRFNQAINQLQSLKHILSPKMIHLMNTFQMGYQDLVTHIHEVSEDNVFLEISKEDSLITMPYKTASISSGPEISEFVADTKGISLFDHAMTQLEVAHLPNTEYAIVKELIEHLDTRGFVSQYKDIQKKLMSTLNISERKVHDGLKILHSFEPDGLGARTLKECFLIQVQSHQFEDDALNDTLKKVIQNHLEDLSKQQYKTISSALGIDEEGVLAIHSFIKDNLDPNPGGAFNNPSLNYHITPSYEVSVKENQLQIKNLEKTNGIQINLSEKYAAILEDPNIDVETKTYLTTKLEKAKELIDNVNQRQENLDTMVHTILTKQMPFLKNGTSFLEPLLQKDLAKLLSLSPSTISRIVSSKYVLTPHGSLSLKSLCPRGYFGKTKERLKRIVKDMIAKYPTYSDEKIKELLHAQNITLARRTVAKYRKIWNIPNHFKRI
ncbi:MAG: hypothetical protein HRT90_01305 [Candidatus Margulisbacteria bacterium]|nr:hypothetical protein [Candidatus Margulisiibacteriota bacterium]